MCVRACVRAFLVTPLRNNVGVSLSFLVANQPATLVRTMSPAGVLSLCAMNIKMKAHTPTRREVSIRARCTCRGRRGKKVEKGCMREKEEWKKELSQLQI